ncbi:MAG: type II toxin-antitoxin system VapB family antitoxin [Candidatus Protistobacter heckmanni]|nr:type II toxin-antitoxin system VapB family antitoxin [Candidatus Protistobacter heckmanni]
MSKTAKLFINGNSQAVRLPMEFRFEGKEVFIRRDARTGDVILSQRPPSWSDFVDLVSAEPPGTDYMQDRDPLPEQERELF